MWNGQISFASWESNTLFLLYTSPACFNIVPKRAFSSGETESFRGLLHEKLGASMAAHRKRISPQMIVFLVVVAVALLLLVRVIKNVQ